MSQHFSPVYYTQASHIPRCSRSHCKRMEYATDITQYNAEQRLNSWGDVTRFAFWVMIYFYKTRLFQQDMMQNSFNLHCNTTQYKLKFWYQLNINITTQSEIYRFSVVVIDPQLLVIAVYVRFTNKTIYDEQSMSDYLWHCTYVGNPHINNIDHSQDSHTYQMCRSCQFSASICMNCRPTVVHRSKIQQ